MTPAQYRQALAALGLTQAEAATLLGVNLTTSQRWARRGAPRLAELALSLILRWQPELADTVRKQRGRGRPPLYLTDAASDQSP